MPSHPTRPSPRRPQAERAAGWPEASLPVIGSPVSFAVRATFRCPELPGGFLCDVYSAFWTRLGEEVARARLVTSICGHFLGFLPIACLHTCGREQITCVQTYIDGVVLRRDVFGSSPAHRSRSNKTLCGNEPVNQLSGFFGSGTPEAALQSWAMNELLPVLTTWE